MTFRDAVRGAPETVLIALDFDGTLAPLVPDPRESRLLAGGSEVLSALGRAGVRVALVTGRAPRTVLELSSLAGVPGLERLRIAGLYGLQVMDAATGEVTTLVDDRTLAAVQAARAELPPLLEGAPDGVHVEDKDIALVVHTRPAADPQGALDALLPRIRELAGRHGLRHEPGRFAAEIRPDGSDKGATLRTLVFGQTPPVTAVLYAGDDTGDLPALQMIAELRSDGLTTLGVAVAQDRTDPDVLAAADLHVDGPPGVLALLRSLLA